MKILGIGKNYVAHKAELAEISKDFKLIFSKPESSLVTGNKDVVYPSFTSKLIYEVELVIKIGKEGKNISFEEAPNYISEIAIGIDYTAKDTLLKIMDHKWAWDLAKGFDGAAPISPFLSANKFENFDDINFSLTINGAQKQIGNTSFMINNFAEIISFVSQYMTLEPGDLIFTGTPTEGIGESIKGDHLQAYLEGQLLLDFKVV